MAIMYSCFDAGAPRPPALTNTGLNSWFLIMRDALVGCLVSGYSGRAAAGWTLKHDRPGVSFAVSPPDNSLVICAVASASGNVVNYFIADSVTTYPLTSVPPIGVNVRSYQWSPDNNPGGFSAGDTAQAGQGMYYATWCLVADANSFAFSAGGGYDPSAKWNTVNDTNLDSYGYSRVLAGGRFKSITGLTGLSNAFCAGGRPSGNAGIGVTSAFGRNLFRATSMLRNPVTGLVIGSGVASPVLEPGWLGAMHLTSQFPPVIPAVAGAEVLLTPVDLSWDGTPVGYFRGIAAAPIGSVGPNYAGSLVKAWGLDVAFPLASSGFRDWFHRPVTLPDGFKYAITYNRSWPVVFTDNPAYWGL